MYKLAGVLVLALFAATGVRSLPSNQPVLPDTVKKQPRWDREQIKISVSDRLLRGPQNIKAGSDIIGAINSSVAAWQPYIDLQFSVTNSEKLSVSPRGVRGDGVTLITMAPTFENVSMFADGKLDVAAKTRVFADRRGNITEADINLNPFAQFSTDGSFGTFDLQAVITHEIGHLLGLEHSEIAGSVMFKNIEQNGVIYDGMPVRKSISAADAASLRSIYGSLPDEVDRYGRVVVRLSPAAGRDTTKYSIWLQDELGRAAASTGRLQGNTLVIGGVSDGSYKVFLTERRRNGRSEQVFVESIAVSAGKTTVVSAKRSGEAADLGVNLIGRGDSLSESPLLLEAGFEGDVFVGGENISAGYVEFFTDSPNISIEKNTAADVDFAEKLSVVRFRIKVDDDAAAGSYTIFARSPGGSVSALVGGLSVSK